MSESSPQESIVYQMTNWWGKNSWVCLFVCHMLYCMMPWHVIPGHAISCHTGQINTRSDQTRPCQITGVWNVVYNGCLSGDHGAVHRSWSIYILLARLHAVTRPNRGLACARLGVAGADRFQCLSLPLYNTQGKKRISCPFCECIIASLNSPVSTNVDSFSCHD